MALIDRQALIDSFCSQCTVDKPETCSTMLYGDKWCNEVYTILNAPTVDAVEVVRCRECRWCNMGECEHKLGLLVSNDENYCSYGERDVDI